MGTPTRVFVYGTLMPGGPLWPTLAPYAASWRPATVPGRLWDTGKGYPCLRFDAAGVPVPGILVALRPELAAEAVAALDAVEDEGELYRRIEVETSAGPAFAYEWLGAVDGLVFLPDGWPARR